MTKELLRLLSNCAAEFFEAHFEKILAKQVSLNEVVKRSTTMAETKSSEVNMAKEANTASYEDLKRKYPEKVKEDTADIFTGAVTMGKNRNMVGDLLKRFVKGLDNDNFVEQVKVKELNTIFDFDLVKMDEFDLIFINLADDKPNYVDAVIDAVGLQRKDYMAVLLLLHSDKELRRVITKLDYWSANPAIEGRKKSTMDIVQLLFQKENRSSNQKKQKKLIEENVQYGVLFGKFHVFHPPLQVLNKELNLSLKRVLSNICPPLSSIAYVQTGRQDIISIHDEEEGNGSGSCVTYFASKQSLEKFLLGPANKIRLGKDIQQAQDAPLVQDVVESDDEDSMDDKEQEDFRNKIGDINEYSIQSSARGAGTTVSGQKEVEESSSLSSPSNTIVGTETDPQEEEVKANMERTGQNIKQRQVRRSGSAWKEKSGEDTVEEKEEHSSELERKDSTSKC